jgi:hypothetical protein
MRRVIGMVAWGAVAAGCTLVLRSTDVDATQLHYIPVTVKAQGKTPLVIQLDPSVSDDVRSDGPVGVHVQGLRRAMARELPKAFGKVFPDARIIDSGAEPDGPHATMRVKYEHLVDDDARRRNVDPAGTFRMKLDWSYVIAYSEKPDAQQTFKYRSEGGLTMDCDEAVRSLVESALSGAQRDAYVWKASHGVP